MEPVLLQYSYPDQSISSPYKQIRNPNRNHRPLISRPFENFAFRGGVLLAPPHSSISFSYPPSISLLNNPQQQPPLLPLPIPKPNHNNSRTRGLSCSPINRKINNRNKDQSLTPKKSKQSSSSLSPKKGDSKRDLLKSTRDSTECLIVESTNSIGPDPKELPKDVSGVLSSSSSDLEKFSGSVVFTLSPPPSSLPLPTFSLRPKLCCNAEAAGIDAGATDNLRRLLRLR